MPIIECRGFTVAYDERGDGDPPMLLVHGMACARQTMAPQLEHFASSRRTVAYDQRGHGGSGSPPGSAYDPASLADDAAAVIGALGLDRPVVVGHSLGGTIALALAARHPELVGALVMLDSTLGFDEAGREGLLAFYDSLGEDTFEPTVRAFVADRLFDPGEDGAAAAGVSDVMASGSPEVFVAMGRGLLEFDVQAAADGVTAPTLYVAASRPWIDLTEVHRAHPSWYLGRTVGSGHFHHMFAAAQVNAMIDAFLARVGAGYAAAASADF